MKIRIIDSGKKSAAEHMAEDKRLLDNLKDGEVVLHLYEWANPFSMTYGYFMRPEKLLTEDGMKKLDMSSRPTGGGFVFHSGDYAFSLLMSSSCPNFSHSVLDNYRTVNSNVLDVLHSLFRLDMRLAQKEGLDGSDIARSQFCMASSSKYDVFVGKRKICGAAQRTVKKGFLHQGSIFLAGSSIEFYRKFLFPDIAESVVSGIDQSSFFPLGFNVSDSVLQEARAEIKRLLIQKFSSWEENSFLSV